MTPDPRRDPPLPMDALTPRRIVEELDKYIVGQAAAKRSVAIALRNRYRRSRLGPDLRDEIIPKNILMIGPTGVGKTEIARRLARLAAAPFANPLEALFGGRSAAPAAPPSEGTPAEVLERRATLRDRLARGELDQEMVEIEVDEAGSPMIEVFGLKNISILSHGA